MISYTKIKDGVFVGPHMKELIEYVKCEDQLSEVEDTKQKSLKKMSPPFFFGGGIISQKTNVIRRLIL
jgi:hypothetical protein